MQDAGDFLGTEFFNYGAVVSESFFCTEAPVGWDQRRGFLDEEIIELGASLAADFQDRRIDA